MELLLNPVERMPAVRPSLGDHPKPQKFIPKEKPGKKARKQLDSEQRITWAFSPVTKKVESKKLYNRKRKAHDRYDDYGMGFSCGVA